MSTKSQNSKHSKEPMFYAMLAPEMPITVMDLEECFLVVPNFGIDDVVIELPINGLRIGTACHAIVETSDSKFLIGPAIIYRTSKSGQDVPITVQDIYALQSMVAERTAILHCGKYNIPAIKLA